MTNEKNMRSEMELRLLNKVLAKLYLDLVPVDNPQREEKLQRFDAVFGRERPSAAEMRRLIQERDAANEDLGSQLQALIPSELIILPEKFEQEKIQAAFEAVLVDDPIVLTRNEKKTLFESIVNDILGFGPLEHAINTEGVSEILVDRYDKIYIERHGKFEDLPYHFRDEEHLMEIIRRILTPLGKKVDEQNPMVDARLPDGSRVNVVLPPVAFQGPSMVIRMFAGMPFTFEDVVRFGSLSQPIVNFLRACVQGKLNIVVSGGTASGKTTILNLVTGLIPPDERVVTVENVVELRPSSNLKRIVRLESQAANADGSGEVSVRDLVINAMRMRPDRLIIGEVRGGEAIDVFQALNTGCDGSMFSMHAKGIRDALSRLETMVYMAMPSLPLLQVRQQMAAAIDLILYQERLRDGTRKVLRVSEVVGMQGDAILVQDIFKFQETGMKDGRIQGQFRPTGYIPTFIKKMHEAGATVPMSLFTPQ